MFTLLCTFMKILFFKIMAVNTKTLSVRVPIDVYNMVENTSKQRGITRNQMLQECIASQGIIGVKSFNEGSQVKPMDNSLTDLLTGIGGLATGSVVYHLLNNNLPNTWDEDTKEVISIAGAIVSAFAVVYGLNKIKEK